MLDSRQVSEKIAQQLAKARNAKIEKLKVRVASGAYQRKSAAIAKAIFK